MEQYDFGILSRDVAPLPNVNSMYYIFERS